MDNLNKEILEIFISQPRDLVEQLEEFHPFDVSQVLLTLENDLATHFLHQDLHYVAEVLEMIEDEEEILRLTEDLQPRRLVAIVQEMEIDNAVDVMLAMDSEDAVLMLRLMEKDNREQIKKFMDYPESSAGALMTTEYISVPYNNSVKQTMRELIAFAKDDREISAIYLTDEASKLVGVLSLRELIIARAEDKLEDIMVTNLIKVQPLTDQSVVAELMSDYDFTVLPVTNRLNHLVGIVTIDDVVDVLVEEHTEDMSQLAGVSDVELDHDTTNVMDSVKNRFPWLLILLFIGFLTSMIIASFEETLNQVPILSMFLPLILNMSGNTGVQSLAVTVRGITTNQFVDKRDVLEHLFREFKTSLVNGLALSLVVFIFSYVYGQFIGQTEISFSIVIAVSIFLALVIATIAGAFIPLVINSLKIDPAVASGPFITTINDIISLTIYLALASTFIVGLS